MKRQKVVKWHCTCGNTPCDGLDCGVWLHAPRKQPAPKTPEQIAELEALAEKADGKFFSVEKMLDADRTLNRFLREHLPAILAALKAQQPDAQAEPDGWLYEAYGVKNADACQLPYWSPSKGTETPLYLHPPKAQQPGDDVSPVEWAFINIVDTVREYLPPDGISKDQFISRVIAQTDNTTINPVIREIERRAAIAAMQESRDADD